MADIEEKAIKELLKNVIDHNNAIPNDAKKDLKTIIELEHNPEKLLLECLMYMMSYRGS